MALITKRPASRRAHRVKAMASNSVEVNSSNQIRVQTTNWQNIEDDKNRCNNSDENLFPIFFLSIFFKKDWKVKKMTIITSSDLLPYRLPL